MPSSPRALRESPAAGPDPAVADGRPWFGALFGLFRSKPSGERAEPGVNALLAFPSESAPQPEPVPIAPVPIADAAARRAPRSSQSIGPRLLRPTLIVVVVLVLSSLALFTIGRFPLPQFTAGSPRVGNLTINSRPVTSEVLVDGERRGMTPLTLSLTPGAHTITVRSGSDERVVPLTIAAGADVTHYFEMKAGEPAALFGRVSVTTDPPGARVAVDGRPRGTSPLTVADLTAEEHKVTVTTDAASAERTVMVTAGGTASVMFSLSKVSGPVGGWLSISAPFNVDVLENAEVIGAGGSSRIMLAAGRHNIMLSNRSLGFEESRSIEVAAGKTTAIRVDPPKVSVSVNARPWAEIVLDGNSVGQTPIANLPVSVGPHEMVFRHPQLGERRQTFAVTSKGPNRIAVDLTK
jgi:PEGA domain-containing protein